MTTKNELFEKIEAQKEKLEAEGHTIIQKGRKNIRYYVKDYENSLFDLKQANSISQFHISIHKAVSLRIDCFFHT